MSTWTKVRSELANDLKKLSPDHPAIAAKRAELRALKLEEHVQRVLSQSPPLTESQKDRIAALLRAGAA